MPARYPPIEPYDHGMLAVGDGHQLYWEACGNPHGKPALVLHGGPGSGCSVNARRNFDPALYRIILFDQRGAGRSEPHASAADVDLSSNTTHHLLADIERLRLFLGIDRWLVYGGSWGSTLALAYAQRQPDRVTEMVLVSIATTTQAEIDWITRGVGAFFPQAWARFRDGVTPDQRSGSLVEAYHHLLMNPDPAIHAKAAADWCDWEMAIVALHPDVKPDPRYESPRFCLGFARLVTHYWRHQAWLGDTELIQNLPSLAAIPAALIHGRLDLGNPLQTPWRLARHWPTSELIIVASAGHDTRDPGMAESIVAATDRFARQR